MKVLFLISILMSAFPCFSQGKAVGSDSIAITHVINNGNKINRIIVKRQYESSHRLSNQYIQYYYLTDSAFNYLSNILAEHNTKEISKYPAESIVYRIVLNINHREVTYDIFNRADAKNYFTEITKKIELDMFNNKDDFEKLFNELYHRSR